MTTHRLRRAAAPVAGRATVPPPGGAPDARQRGSVLLETALAIPMLVAVAAALAWTLSLATTSAGLADAARSAARDIARGVSVEQAVAAAESAVPGAAIRVESGDRTITVVAERRVEAPVPILRGVGVDVRQSVSVPAEWT